MKYKYMNWLKNDEMRLHIDYIPCYHKTKHRNRLHTVTCPVTLYQHHKKGLHKKFMEKVEKGRKRTKR